MKFKFKFEIQKDKMKRKAKRKEKEKGGNDRLGRLCLIPTHLAPPLCVRVLLRELALMSGSRVSYAAVRRQVGPRCQPNCARRIRARGH